MCTCTLLKCNTSIPGYMYSSHMLHFSRVHVVSCNLCCSSGNCLWENFHKTANDNCFNCTLYCMYVRVWCMYLLLSCPCPGICVCPVPPGTEIPIVCTRLHHAFNGCHGKSCPLYMYSMMLSETWWRYVTKSFYNGQYWYQICCLKDDLLQMTDPPLHVCF